MAIARVVTALCLMLSPSVLLARLRSAQE